MSKSLKLFCIEINNLKITYFTLLQQCITNKKAKKENNQHQREGAVHRMTQSSTIQLGFDDSTSNIKHLLAGNRF